MPCPILVLLCRASQGTFEICSNLDSQSVETMRYRDLFPHSMARDRGFTKGWFPRGWFWRMFLDSKHRNEGIITRRRAQEPVFLDPKNRNEGTKKRNDSTVQKKRNNSTKKPERGCIRQNRPKLQNSPFVSWQKTGYF